MTPVDTPPEDLTTVFVSYSRADQKRAAPVIQLLKRAGYSVWWDGMLEAGERYLETTEHALETARAVIVLWSANSVNSDWVRDEAMSGRERKCLVPISLDGTMPPLGFRQIQAIDLTGWTDKADSPRTMEILRVVAALHGDAIPDRLPPRALQPQASRRWLLIGAAAGVTGFAAGAAALRAGLPILPRKKLEEFGLVVLPFENLSGTDENTVLANALDIEVRKTLARNPAFRIVARTSSRAVQQEGLSAAEISRRLGVKCLLEGTISISQGVVQIATSLVEGLNGLVRWSETYQGSLENILEFQSAIARAVTANVAAELSQPDTSLRYGNTTNPAAFEAFLRGRDAYVNVQTLDDLTKALEQFDLATELDPNFAEAFAIKARVYVYRSGVTTKREDAERDRRLAVDVANHAIALAPDSADAFSTLADVNFSARLDIAAARAPFETSRNLGYGIAPVMTRYATFSACRGDAAAAFPAMRRALELDPLNANLHARSGLILYLFGQYDAAISAFEQADRIRPSSVYRPSQIAMALHYSGRSERALAQCQDETSDIDRLTCEAIVQRALGNEAAATIAETTLVQSFDDAPLYQMAQIRAQAGDTDAALDLLTRAIDTTDQGLVIVKMDPAFAALRTGADFSRLLASLGFDA